MRLLMPVPRVLPPAHWAAAPSGTPLDTAFDELHGQPLPPPEGLNTSALAPLWARFFSLLPTPPQPASGAPLPLLLPAPEWQALQAGLLPRLPVLQALLQDSYGPRRLVQQGLLPAALVQGHPDYLHALHGARPAAHGPVQWSLHWAAFDVLRDTQGHWWLQAQRTQAPAGLGHWLAQRALSAQHHGPALAALGVRPLQGNCAAFTQHLLHASGARHPAQLPQLAPAPDASSAHADATRLAHHLGLPLAHGADISVRQGRLHRHGQPVPGLLKLLPDAALDPQELRPDAHAGIPGLLHACRSGHTLLANPPGTGWLESRALLGFLPALAAHLQQPPALPALPTWWCGEAAALQHVLAHLGEYLIRPSYPWSLSRSTFGHGIGPWMSPEVRQAWAHDIAQRPEEHTAQRYQPPALLPAWATHVAGAADTAIPALQLRPYRLRLFALAHAPGHWRLLPGGLVCFTDSPGGFADAWVCTA